MHDAVHLIAKALEKVPSVRNSVNLPRYQRLWAELARAYKMGLDERQNDVVSMGAQEESKTCRDKVEPMSVQEAARVLGLSPRSVQRLAPAWGRKIRGRWALDRDLVLALKNEREKRADDA